MSGKKAKESTRHGSREVAFQVLYGLCFSPANNMGELEKAFLLRPKKGEIAKIQDAPEQKQGEQEESSVPAAPEGFAWELVKGVWSNVRAIDEQIVKHSRHWRMDRIGKIELTILRICVFEMLFQKEVPFKVAIDEALELTKSFASAEAASFVNGVLNAAISQAAR